MWSCMCEKWLCPSGTLQKFCFSEDKTREETETSFFSNKPGIWWCYVCFQLLLEKHVFVVAVTNIILISTKGSKAGFASGLQAYEVCLKKKTVICLYHSG